MKGLAVFVAVGLTAQLWACSSQPTQSATAQREGNLSAAETEVVSPGESRAARNATERGRRCRAHRGIRAARSVGCTDEEIDVLLGTLPDGNRGLDRILP